MKKQPLPLNSILALMTLLCSTASFTHNLDEVEDCNALAPDCFITTWKTDNPGSSNNSSISLPTSGTGYLYDVDWENDGVFDDLGVTGSITHDYLLPGTYQIAIRGAFPRIFFNYGGDRGKLVSIDQWGSIQWSTMATAFLGCSNLELLATDAPDLSNVTSLSQMFQACGLVNADISHWDVSNVTDMQLMFYFASSFDQDLGDWNISNATNLLQMLQGTALSITNYDSTLIKWSQQPVQNNVHFGALDKIYCEGSDARQELIENHNWVIMDAYQYCAAKIPFITTWKTDNPGLSPNTEVRIPAPFPLTYSYDVDWENDGFYDDLNVTGTIAHDYGSPGTYQVAIRGYFPATRMAQLGDQQRLISIDQWGDMYWTSMTEAFKNCTNLVINASDAPDLRLVTSLAEMFKDCASLTSGVSLWDVGTITDMTGLFYGASAFNEAIGDWDMRAVTTIFNMFHDCTSFNQDISGWELNQLASMTQAFTNATSFDQDLGNWNVSQVTSMLNAFNNSAISPMHYDSMLMKWADQAVLSNVEVGSKGLAYCDGLSARMDLINNHGWDFKDDIYNCGSTVPFITTWKTDNPGTSSAISITIPTIGGGYDYEIDWENDGIFDDVGVSGTITHEYPTAGTYQIAIRGQFPRIYFNNEGDREKLLSIDSWGNQAWSSMEHAFWGCENVILNATDAPDLNQATSLQNMFASAELINTNLSHWDVSNITNMIGTFWRARNFDQNLGQWDIGQVTNMNAMLSESNLSVANYDSTLIAWEVQSVQSNVRLVAQDLKFCNGQAARSALIEDHNWQIFSDSYDCPNATPLILTINTLLPGSSSSASFTVPINPSYDYDYDVDWDNDGVYDDTRIKESITHDYATPGTYQIAIKGFFPSIYFFNAGDREKLVSVDQWGDQSWETMSTAFHGCKNMVLNALDAPDLSMVNNTSNMFAFCETFNQDISFWDMSNIRFMRAMFNGAKSFNQNIGSWDVSQVTDMALMFASAEAFNQDIGGWDVSQVIFMERAFSGATQFNQNLNQWDVSQVIKMFDMFQNAVSFNGDIGSWNVGNVTQMSGMFNNANAFNQDISNWDVSKNTSLANLFREAQAFDQNLGAWDIDSVTDMFYMLFNSGLSALNYDSTLIGWSSQNVQPGVSLYAEGLAYCNGVHAREALMNDKSWTFLGDQLDCSPMAKCKDASLTLTDDCSLPVLATPLLIDAGSSDPNGLVTLFLSPSLFDFTDLGPNLVTLTVVNTTSDTVTCDATLTVIDERIRCRDVTVFLNTGQSISIVPQDLLLPALTNCDIIQESLSQQTFTTGDIGSTVPVQATVTFETSNTATCTSLVTISSNPDCPNILVVNDPSLDTVMNKILSASHSTYSGFVTSYVAIGPATCAPSLK